MVCLHSLMQPFYGVVCYLLCEHLSSRSHRASEPLSVIPATPPMSATQSPPEISIAFQNVCCPLIRLPVLVLVFQVLRYERNGRRLLLPGWRKIDCIRQCDQADRNWQHPANRRGHSALPLKASTAPQNTQEPRPGGQEIRARRVQLDWPCPRTGMKEHPTVCERRGRDVGWALRLAAWSANHNRGKGDVMADKKTPKCAHPGCECPVQKGNKYCSPYCESVGSRLSIACECGHTECAGGEAVRAAG